MKIKFYNIFLLILITQINSNSKYIGVGLTSQSQLQSTNPYITTSPDQGCSFDSLILGANNHSNCQQQASKENQFDPVSRIGNYKHYEMNNIRISEGYSAYLLDVSDAFLLNVFKSEVQAAFSAFSSIAVRATPGSDENTKPQDSNQYVTLGQLEQGIQQYQWKIPISARDLLYQYDLNQTKALNFKEFTYLAIIENIKQKNYLPEQNCQHCFKQTTNEIMKLFNYLDCNHDGFISSEDIFYGMQNVRTIFKLTNTMTNDFVLKTMEYQTATVDKKEFIYGFMVGMFERVIGSNKIDENAINQLKSSRREAADKMALKQIHRFKSNNKLRKN